jgi:transcriptional regulator with XRE-family HTH domain
MYVIVTIMVPFGQWLLNRLEEKGWSMSELGRRCDTTHATISRLISGERKPSPELTIRLAYALDVTPEEVFRRVWLPSSMATGMDTKELLEYVESLTREERAELLRYARYLYHQRRSE